MATDTLTGTGTPAGHIYWVVSCAGTINEASLAGGDVSTPITTEPFGLFGVAVDASNIYWAGGLGGTINEAPLTGGVPTTLVSGLDNPIAVAVDGSHIYWADRQDAASVDPGLTPRVRRSPHTDMSDRMRWARSAGWWSGTCKVAVPSSTPSVAVAATASATNGSGTRNPRPMI